MTLRCIYSEEPNFPATDQHPDAVRFRVGAVWVDAIGARPSQAEVDAVLAAPEPKPDRIDELVEVLKAKGIVTDQDFEPARAAR